jgi:hypothetical protein
MTSRRGGTTPDPAPPRSYGAEPEGAAGTGGAALALEGGALVPASGPWHTPPLQPPASEQRFPHPPQFTMSVAVSTHAPAQNVFPAGHLQAPSTHA